VREPDAPPIYALRVAEDARRQIDAELVRLFDAVGEDAAVSWRLGMEDALASLATLPARAGKQRVPASASRRHASPIAVPPLEQRPRMALAVHSPRADSQ